MRGLAGGVWVVVSSLGEGGFWRNHNPRVINRETGRASGQRDDANDEIPVSVFPSCILFDLSYLILAANRSIVKLSPCVILIS